MDIVLRESERLNETIRSFLAYARPQRFEVQRLDLRRVVRTRRRCCATAPRWANVTPSISGCRRTRCCRSRRKPGSPDRLEPRDQRPARHAQAAARLTLSASSRRWRPAGRGADRHRRRRRHGARRARGHLPAVPRVLRQGQRPRPGHRASHHQRLQRARSTSNQQPGRGTTFRVTSRRCAGRRPSEPAGDVSALDADRGRLAQSRA